MSNGSWFQTDKVWLITTLIFFILATCAHIWIQLTGGYSSGSYLDMIPHFLYGASICALFLNFNIGKSWKKVIPIIPPLLLVILPAILYTLAVAFAWEILEEFLSIFLPWLGFYSDFWWNGVRDIIVGFFGALVGVGLYLRHFPKIVEQREGLHRARPKTPPPSYIPGKTAMHYCDACGAILPADAKHCPHCGHKC
jgi:hypothetical protein